MAASDDDSASSEMWLLTRTPAPEGGSNRYQHDGGQLQWHKGGIGSHHIRGSRYAEERPTFGQFVCGLACKRDKISDETPR